MTRQTV